MSPPAPPRVFRGGIFFLLGAQKTPVLGGQGGGCPKDRGPPGGGGLARACRRVARDLLGPGPRSRIAPRKCPRLAATRAVSGQTRRPAPLARGRLIKTRVAQLRVERTTGAAIFAVSICDPAELLLGSGSLFARRFAARMPSARIAVGHLEAAVSYRRRRDWVI